MHRLKTHACTAFFAVLALLAGGGTVAEAGELIDRAKQDCIAEWPNDYRMQLHCFNQQLDGLQFIQDFSKKYPQGTPEEEILARCVALWMVRAPKRDAYMVRHCTIKEVAAMRTMRAGGH